MSANQSKNNYWVVTIKSSYGPEIPKIKIPENDLISNDPYEKNILDRLTRTEEDKELFKRKAPLYLAEALVHLFHEIELETNPLKLDFFTSREVDKIIQSSITAEKNTKSEEERFVKRLSEKNLDEHIRLKILEKVQYSKLDKAIIVSEDSLDDLIHLFKGIPILKNQVFFALFQNWFQSPEYEYRIDDFISLLKKMHIIAFK